MGHPLIYFLFVSIQCLESFTRISDGSLSDIIIPSEEKNIKIEECQDKIETETETENSQGDKNFINNNLEEPENETDENNSDSENVKFNGSDNRVSWVKSIRGKDKAFYHGYCYTKNRTNKDTISWSCEDINRHKCPGRIQTKGDKVVKVLNEHTHDEKPIKEAIYQTIESIKAKTLEGSATPAELVEQELSKLDPTIQGQMVQVRSIKRMAQRLLKKNRIKHNSSLQKGKNILDKNCDFSATRYEHLKDFFKFESSKLREDGKIEIEFSCFKCQTNQKAILKTSSIDATPYNLQFHMKKVHPTEVWKFYEATKSKRKRKRLWIPDKGPFICPECQGNFSSSEALKNHWKIKHKTIKHKPYDKLEEECLCNLCGKTFKRKSYLKEHLKEVHERLPYICSECQKEYPSKHTLKIHLWGEHNIGKDMSCVCTLCDEVKTTKYGLKQHMKAKHEGLKDHVCHLCGTGFSLPQGLKNHIQRIHEHSGKYVCDYCDFKTVVPNKLKMHENEVHTKAVKYSCEDCNFFCYRKDGLSAHIKSVHLKLKPHKCSECSEAFLRRKELEKHKLTSGH